MTATEVRIGWAYRVNERGFRIGGYAGVVRRRVAIKGRWAWRERFRCDHNHPEPTQAIDCARSVKMLA